MSDFIYPLESQITGSGINVFDECMDCIVDQISTPFWLDIQERVADLVLPSVVVRCVWLGAVRWEQ